MTIRAAALKAWLTARSGISRRAYGWLLVTRSFLLFVALFGLLTVIAEVTGAPPPHGSSLLDRLVALPVIAAALYPFALIRPVIYLIQGPGAFSQLEVTGLMCAVLAALLGRWREKRWARLLAYALMTCAATAGAMPILSSV